LQIKLLAILLVTSSIFVSYPVFGQTNPITVQTDKTSYADGDNMIISGTVTDQLNIPISIVIKNSQTPVYIAQTSVDPTTNTYSVQAVAGGNLWKNTGTYEIDVTYGGPDKTAKTTFLFTGNSKTTQSGNNQTVSTPQNQTQVPAIPEFGPLAIMIFAISVLAIITCAKIGPVFRL
jgi:hypothetical protein